MKPPTLTVSPKVWERPLPRAAEEVAVVAATTDTHLCLRAVKVVIAAAQEAALALVATVARVATSN